MAEDIGDAGFAAWLRETASDAALDDPAQWRRRDAVLDRLDAWRVLGSCSGDTELQSRVDALEARLLGIDRALHDWIRSAIRRGEGRQVLRAAIGERPRQSVPPSSDRYDALDTFLGGVLGIEPPVAEQPPGPDMVFYQPTPARHILDSLERLQLGRDDVLVDLGAGLGHVPLLAAIYTPARCIGIEWQATHVEAARNCAHGLGLAQVAFLQGDIREADLAEGTVFYLYTPVTGAALRRVLERLQAEAARRTIRLCTLGPCTEAVAGEAWLRADGIRSRHRPVVFRSV